MNCQQRDKVVETMEHKVTVHGCVRAFLSHNAHANMSSLYHGNVVGTCDAWYERINMERSIDAWMWND